MKQKFRSGLHFPDAFVVCFGSLLVTASATVLNFNEANNTNVWTAPVGTNLLAAATTVPGTAPTNYGSSSSWATLTDGNLGATNPYPSGVGTLVMPNSNTEVVFALNLTGHPGGYDVASFDSYCEWNDSGRDNQNFTISYSTVSAPTTFVTIAAVANNGGGGVKSTHTSLTDTTGHLATGVHSIKIHFDAQENDAVGYSEFKLIEVGATSINTVVESASTNVWTLPAGTNLLSGLTANSPSIPENSGHGGGGTTSSDWSTLTDGSIGTATLDDEVADRLSAVGPNSNTSVIFPLDLTTNFNGYNITSLNTYCAWKDSGRDNQDITIRYSTVTNPTVFLPLANAVAHDDNPNISNHVGITSSSGVLATGVAAIQFGFGAQENGFVGYREFVALGTPVPVSTPITWAGNSGTGGNANWITGPDNNWKASVGGAPTNFSSIAQLTFDNIGINRNITASALTASSMTFANDAAHSYTIGGGLIQTTFGITATGNGSATFNNAVKATTGVAISDSGSATLVFNGALESPGVTLSGFGGGITLAAANPALTGVATVNDGTLKVTHNDGLKNATLLMAGGEARFTSPAPSVSNISTGLGGYGVIVLGNPSGPGNTNLTVGNSVPVTTFAGDISNATGGAVGSLTKTGSGLLALAGINTYTGTTTVSGGTLEFDTRTALYNGNTASWTPAKITVGSGATLALGVDSSSLFNEADITPAFLGAFQAGSFLGLCTFEDFTLIQDWTKPQVGLVKLGFNSLTLTGNNTSTGDLKIIQGQVYAHSAGTAISGNVIMGNGTDYTYLTMSADNQFGPNSVITMTNGDTYDSKVSLGGTQQTISGLDSAPLPANRVSLVENDEAVRPGFVSAPGPASLTINATTDHSFYGLIRDQDGGPVSVIKNGPGTQEFRNMPLVQGYGYTGPTTINGGKLRIAFRGGNNGFNSDITVGAGAFLEFNASDGNYAFNKVIAGPGKVLVTGASAVVFANTANTLSGGITVDGGFLALNSNGSTGAGTATGQFCVAGAMDPSNVINVINAGTLSLDNIAALGNSGVLPQFAPSIRIGPGSRLFGGTNTVAFVPNLTLDGGSVDITSGAGIGGFNTDLTFVGTVIVGGSSSLPSVIATSGTGANANASLGSAGLPGTIFQVADVTASSNVDLTISSILQNVGGVASPLRKTGPGTLFLQGPKTYTGATTVDAGILRIDTGYLADTADVTVAAGASLDLTHSVVDTVGRLTLGGVPMAVGIYGSNANSTPGINHSPYITGTGMLYVSTAPGTSYETWSLIIPNPADRGRAADPDGDGFTNLQEFLFGTSPVAASGSLSTSEQTPSGLVVRWNQRATGGSVYTLQESTTLLDNPWPTSSAIITNSAVQNVTDYIRKEALVPISGPRRFVRVKAAE